MNIDYNPLNLSFKQNSCISKPNNLSSKFKKTTKPCCIVWILTN